MKVKIERIDDYGRGIAFVNDKITFVENALPSEEVLIKLVNEKSKYNEAIVLEYLKVSEDRTENNCPYTKCGGCQLRHFSPLLEKEFKINKVKNTLKKFAGIEIDPDYFETNRDNYRNKITFKVVNGRIGYYKSKSNRLIEVKECKLAKEEINNVIHVLKKFGVMNGEIVIRSNYNKELLISISTKNKVNIFSGMLDYKVVGVVVNGKVIFGEDKFIEIIDGMFFQISYDAFFQVNNNVNNLVFKKIKEIVKDDSIVMDLYCGVGTLGLSLNEKLKKLYGIEVSKNAVVNAMVNAKMNKISNTSFHVGDVKNVMNKINEEFDYIIVDPPRSGLDKEVIDELLNAKPNNIIYMSCDPITLARDLKLLNDNYAVNSSSIFNMFPYTTHVETICLLEKK